MLEGYNGACKEVEVESATVVRRVDGLQEFGCIREERQMFDIGITGSRVNGERKQIKAPLTEWDD